MRLCYSSVNDKDRSDKETISYSQNSWVFKEFKLLEENEGYSVLQQYFRKGRLLLSACHLCQRSQD